MIPRIPEVAQAFFAAAMAEGSSRDFRRGAAIGRYFDAGALATG